MNVADLIGQLQTMPPGLPVRVPMREVEQEFAEGDSVALYLTEASAVAADDVRRQGGFVLITGG